MLKAVKILGSSSTFRCVSFLHRLNNPLAKSWLSSRNPMKASEFSRTHSLPFQLREGGGFRAFRVAHAYAEATPPQASFSSSSSTSVAVQSTGSTKKINFCQLCGCPTKYEIPDGDDKTRAVCTNCGKITYENPKMVVGCLVEHENKILLCKRKIQPSFGLWTLPAGYMEIGESAAEGAIRETWEEATAEVEVLSPFALLDIPLISHIYIFFLGKLKRPHFSPGPESQECQLFALEDIPLNSLAFSSMVVALKMYTEDREAGGPKFHYAVINKWPGSGPSDIHAYTLALHLTF